MRGVREAGAKFKEIVEKYGGEANFAMGGTSRVWAQPPYGTLKSIFPTPNAHLPTRSARVRATSAASSPTRSLAVDGG